MAIQSGGSEVAAISLGSNQGHSLAILQGVVADLAATPASTLLACSRWYLTAPIGPPQPDYWNGCVLLSTALDPEVLLQRLWDLEHSYGRQRSERWGPRTLDLDLIFLGQQRWETPRLWLPHPRFRERGFVLVPLAEIAPDWIDPVSGYTVAQLLTQVDTTGVRPADIPHAPSATGIAQ
ncbi:MAG: 2-amino-4-hydroxy-6-hydroxymethyldihydropteridine diphosphokinase [Gloeomargaritaceae cyanobacterium C42_A2020_066]|nr:2-amino-4-hydroxy-6-hydroxymethyldihydropteridine diphosphokinase [Gloeomargaritaceae cyanobacterium C42_A2020_066]